MNSEIKITIIASIVIFAGIGFLAMNSMNPEQVIKSPPEIIPDKIKAKESIKNDSNNGLTGLPQTGLIKIDDNLSLEKTLVFLSVSENNQHPWGIVKGQVKNPAPGYPVVIQFFKSIDGDPIHVAQVELGDDNSFEYQFRILSIDEGITTHYFQGDYYIKIFKTVNTPTEN